LSYYFVVNPVSGRGKTARAWEQLKAILEAENIPFSYSLTQAPGHATELAKQAVEQGYTSCIGVGGDGTLHEMLPALIGTNTALGCIPTGTGNDFARVMRIPKDINAQLGWLKQAARVHIDIPYINDTPYLNVAGIGFDAVVAETVNQRFRSLHGIFPYLLGTFATLISYKNTPVTIHLDGYPPVQQKVFLIAVGNMQYYGGGFRICPHAVPNDSLLDFCIAGDISKLGTLSVLPRTRKGKHLSHPQCRYVRATGAYIDGPPLPIQADGQRIGTLPATFKLSPGALWILSPTDVASRLPNA
jgi:diacylglycerol kinase (ATP)